MNIMILIIGIILIPSISAIFAHIVKKREERENPYEELVQYLIKHPL